ncbi:MAG: Crp/Fnr family transcriptional regulator [Thermoanaerobaculia bacterium]
MPAVEDTSELESIPLFGGLSAAELERVNELLRRKAFAAGASLMTAEQPGEVVYVLLEGSAKIFVEQEDGTEVVLAFLSAGDTIGEMSLIDSAGRSADVVVVERATCLWLDRAAFHRCLREMPALGFNLYRLLCRRLRLANEQLQAISTLDVVGRVARQLLAFAQQYGRPADGGLRIPFKLNQSDVAGLVGASRERVNHAMADLKERGAIAVEGSQITVLDPQALAARFR